MKNNLCNKKPSKKDTNTDPIILEPIPEYQQLENTKQIIKRLDIIIEILKSGGK